MMYIPTHFILIFRITSSPGITTTGNFHLRKLINLIIFRDIPLSMQFRNEGTQSQGREQSARQ